MIKFKFKHEETEFSVNAPDCWEDVTVRHFINPYFLSRDGISLLSVLSGLPRDILLNTKEDIMGPLMRMVEFARVEPDGFKKEPPKEFMLMDTLCKVPQDIELERIGQKILFQDALAKYEFVYNAIPDVIAIYLLPELNDGKFDDSLLPDIIEAVKDLPIMDVHPLATFFLTSLKAYQQSGMQSLVTSPHLTKSSMNSTKQQPETGSENTESSN